MTSVAEQFGRESHIVMGAVVDEQLQNRVEICVIGTSDMGGRSIAPRRVVRPRAQVPASEPAAEPAAVSRSDAAGEPVQAAAAGPTRQAAAAAAAAAAAKAQQEEFGFGEVESRGSFEKTDRNLFDGQDLDVPTYLRKGIKIAI